MIPYDPPMIAKLLRTMPRAHLATATPVLFQTWPAAKITPSPVILEMIRNERARRH